MKLRNNNDIEKLKSAVALCKNDVWLESPYGDKFNLKSPLCAMCAFVEIVKEHREDLDLYCSKEDELIFLKFFSDNPDFI